MSSSSWTTLLRRFGGFLVLLRRMAFKDVLERVRLIFPLNDLERLGFSLFSEVSELSGSALLYLAAPERVLLTFLPSEDPLFRFDFRELALSVSS